MSGLPPEIVVPTGWERERADVILDDERTDRGGAAMERIIVGTDTSGRAEAAVRAAADLALAEGAELLILHVRPPGPHGLLDARKPVDADAYLHDIVRGLRGLRARVRVEDGDPADRICRVAEDEGADLIVVGNLGMHGRGRRFLGSVPVAVLRRARSSVLVVDTREAG